VLYPGKGPGYVFFRWLLQHHARDLAAMETVVRATPLDWTIARPPRLTASSDERYRTELDALINGASAMSFRAVAAFMLDSIERRTFSRAVVGLDRSRANGRSR
jgi:hypothetical protein